MASTKTSKSATRKGTAKPKPRTEAAIKKPARSSKQRATKKDEVTIDRRGSGDRRGDSDRRAKSQPVAVERRKLQRREKVQRRRQIDPTTCERDYSEDEVEFMQALDEYKRRSGRMFPTCSEVLEVLRGLGYQKVASTTIAEAVESALRPATGTTDAGQ